jgi:hypothetical protein
LVLYGIFVVCYEKGDISVIHSSALREYLYGLLSPLRVNVNAILSALAARIDNKADIQYVKDAPNISGVYTAYVQSGNTYTPKLSDGYTHNITLDIDAITINSPLEETPGISIVLFLRTIYPTTNVSISNTIKASSYSISIQPDQIYKILFHRTSDVETIAEIIRIT